MSQMWGDLCCMSGTSHYHTGHSSWEIHIHCHMNQKPSKLWVSPPRSPPNHYIYLLVTPPCTPTWTSMSIVPSPLFTEVSLDFPYFSAVLVLMIQKITYMVHRSPIINLGRKYHRWKVSYFVVPFIISKVYLVPYGNVKLKLYGYKVGRCWM